jgi:hypothetical protein
MFVVSIMFTQGEADITKVVCGGCSGSTNHGPPIIYSWYDIFSLTSFEIALVCESNFFNIDLISSRPKFWVLSGCCRT